MKKRGVLIAVAACLVLAAASLLIPSAPTTDPWGWIVWGREVTHLDLSTRIGGAPSWKPLPVLFTAPLSLAGGAAPYLWLLVARAAALLGLLFTFRLGSRLAGRFAGLAAAAGLLLSAGWMRSFLHGYAEPLAIALMLMAVDRHWAGRPRQALLLAAGVALVRPEAFPLVILYGAFIWRESPRRGFLVAAVAILVPALWLVPDWIGSGDPFHAGRVSSAVEPHGIHAALTALAGGASITPIPLSLTAVAGFAIARRNGDRRVVELSAVALGWAALLLALMLAGYPASARFFVLPAALVCLLGSVGAVRALEPAFAGTRRAQVAAVVALAALPFLAVRVAATGVEARDAVRRAGIEDSLAKAIAAAGPARLRACGIPVLPVELSWLRGDVAWRLGLPLRGVRPVRTTADAYLESLSRSGMAAIPREVTVRTHRHHLVLLAPFGRTRLRVVAGRGVDLDTVTRAGNWLLLVPDSTACTGRQRRATRAA